MFKAFDGPIVGFVVGIITCIYFVYIHKYLARWDSRGVIVTHGVAAFGGYFYGFVRLWYMDKVENIRNNLVLY